MFLCISVIIVYKSFYASAPALVQKNNSSDWQALCSQVSQLIAVSASWITSHTPHHHHHHPVQLKTGFLNSFIKQRQSHSLIRIVAVPFFLWLRIVLIYGSNIIMPWAYLSENLVMRQLAKLYHLGFNDPFWCCHEPNANLLHMIPLFIY